MGALAVVTQKLGQFGDLTLGVSPGAMIQGGMGFAKPLVPAARFDIKLQAVQNFICPPIPVLVGFFSVMAHAVPHQQVGSTGQKQ